MDSPRNIARLNVEHYRRLLTAEGEPTKRETITKLLAEEEAKLRKLDGDRERQRHQSGFFHSRQWLGRTSRRSLVSTSIQPPRMRRQERRAWVPS